MGSTPARVLHQMGEITNKEDLTMGKSSVAQILVTRDQISMEEAMARVKECSRRLNEEAVADGDYELAIDIIAEELGLEPDYMMDLLYEV